MRYIQVTPAINQNILDIAIQYYGGVEGLPMLIVDNPSLFLSDFVSMDLPALNIRANIQDMEGVNEQELRAIRALLGKYGSVATASPRPNFPSCDLITMAEFSQSPANYDSGNSNEFLSMDIALALPNTIITQIQDVVGMKIYTEFDVYITSLEVNTNDGMVASLGDFFAPTYLPSGLYYVEGEVLVEIEGAENCTYLYKSYFTIA